MKDFACLVLLVGAAVWFFHGRNPAEVKAPGATAATPPQQRAIIVAPVSNQRGEGWDTTLAQDDQAMAAERLRSWQEKTNPPKPPQAESNQSLVSQLNP